MLARWSGACWDPVGSGVGEGSVSGLMDDDISPAENDFDFFFPKGLQREDLPSAAELSCCSLATGKVPCEFPVIKIGETTRGGGLGDRAVVEEGGDMYPKLLLTDPPVMSWLYSPWEGCE